MPDTDEPDGDGDGVPDGKEGLYLEFGVGRGKSMRWIAPQAKGTVYGFDSFDGIQEYWNGNPVGAFAQKKLPKVPDNVEFEIGYFDATLPGFLEKHAEPIAFLHVDCDLYSSTVTIFDALGSRQKRRFGHGHERFARFQIGRVADDRFRQLCGCVAGRVSIRRGR